MSEAQAIRNFALKSTAAGSGAASVTPAAEATRLSIRADEKAAKALSKALDVTLPMTPLTSSSASGRTALWLGPDEWLVIDETGADMMVLCQSANALHSAVDISHRNTAIILKGPAAAETLNAACPLDLALTAFPVGKCARTVLAKVEIVVLRKAHDEFRVECWRSFAPYVFGMLNEGAMDAAG